MDYTRHLELQVALLSNLVKQFAGDDASRAGTILRHWDPDLRIPSARSSIDDYLARERLLPPSSVRAEAREALASAGAESDVPLVEGVFLVSPPPADIVSALGAVLPAPAPDALPAPSTFPYAPQVSDGLHVWSNAALSADTLASFAQPDCAALRVLRVEAGGPRHHTSGPDAARIAALHAARRLHELLLQELEQAVPASFDDASGDNAPADEFSHSSGSGARAALGGGLVGGHPQAHVFLASADELLDSGALRDLARARGRQPPPRTPAVLRSFYGLSEGRPVGSHTMYGCCLTVSEPLSFHLLAQYCREVSGLDAEGVAAAFLPEPPKGAAAVVAATNGGGSSWQEALPSATLTQNTALLIPRTFVLLSRYPAFSAHFEALRRMALVWQRRMLTAVRGLLGLRPPPPLPAPLAPPMPFVPGDPTCLIARWMAEAASGAAGAGSPTPAAGTASGSSMASSVSAVAEPLDRTVIADVVSQGKYRWELASRLQRVHADLAALEASAMAHGGYGPIAGSSGAGHAHGHHGVHGHSTSMSATDLRAAAAAAAVAAGSAAAPPAGPLSYTERNRYEARLRDLQGQQGHLSVILGDVTARLRAAGRRLLAVCVSRAFEGPLGDCADAIAELLTLPAPPPGSEAQALGLVAASESSRDAGPAPLRFVRPVAPWSFASADGAASGQAPSFGSCFGGSAEGVPVANSALVRFLRAFVEDVAPFDPGSHNALARARGTGAGSDPAAAALSAPAAWSLGADLRHPETAAALHAWALPALCARLAPSDLVDVLAAALVEMNVVFVAEGPFDRDGAGSPVAASSRPMTSNAGTSVCPVSRCVLGLASLLAPLSWEQNLRPRVPLATAQALRMSGPEVLAQANLLGAMAMGGLPDGLASPTASTSATATATGGASPAGAYGATSALAGSASGSSSRSLFADGGGAAAAAADGGSAPPQPQHGRRRSFDLGLGSLSLGLGRQTSGLGSGTSAASASAASAAAAADKLRSQTLRSKTAAEAELVLVSVASGRVTLFSAAGARPIGEAASSSSTSSASACRMPDREGLIAAVTSALGDAFSPAAAAADPTRFPHGPAQVAAAHRVADAVSSHIRWMLASLYLAALPPLVAARGLALPADSSGSGEGGAGSGSSAASLAAVAAAAAAAGHPLPPGMEAAPPSPPDLASAARAELLAHLPTSKQLQRTGFRAMPFWARFAATQLLQQHHQIRGARVFAAAFRGADPTLLTDSREAISRVITAMMASNGSGSGSSSGALGSGAGGTGGVAGSVGVGGLAPLVASAASTPAPSVAATPTPGAVGFHV